jgi:peptidoglycan hydrolase-like protein with peptidoglycan-binding domain
LLLAVVLGAIVTTLVWLWSSAEVTDAAQPADGASAAANAASEVAGAEILLERGDTGDEVARWQELLRSAGIDLQADGKYGPQTEAATRRFQKTLGEEPTGQVTTHTMDAAERLSSFDVLDVHFVRDGDLEAVRRRVDRTALARGVLRALLAAPLQAERDDGLSTAIPPATAVHSLEVDGGVASIELSGFAEEPDEAMRVRVDQVVRTLTQFDAVDAVLFVLPPEDARAFAEAGVTLGEPVRGGDG